MGSQYLYIVSVAHASTWASPVQRDGAPRPSENDREDLAGDVDDLARLLAVEELTDARPPEHHLSDVVLVDPDGQHQAIAHLAVDLNHELKFLGGAQSPVRFRPSLHVYGVLVPGGLPELFGEVRGGGSKQQHHDV